MTKREAANRTLTLARDYAVRARRALESGQRRSEEPAVTLQVFANNGEARAFLAGYLKAREGDMHPNGRSGRFFSNAEGCWMHLVIKRQRTF